jgi:hypothetical protein
MSARRFIGAVAICATVVFVPALPAMADVSTAQVLPTSACNDGTMTAHESIPEATGTGVTTPAHMDVPGTGNVTPCGHGG